VLPRGVAAPDDATGAATGAATQAV
jgi:hypothetical protein